VPRIVDASATAAKTSATLSAEATMMLALRVLIEFPFGFALVGPPRRALNPVSDTVDAWVTRYLRDSSDVR
jgi:hypothetical protein